MPIVVFVSFPASSVSLLESDVLPAVRVALSEAVPLEATVALVPLAIEIGLTPVDS